MNARGLTSFMSGNSLRPHIPGVFMRDARLSWFYLVVSQQKVSHSLLSLAAAEARSHPAYSTATGRALQEQWSCSENDDNRIEVVRSFREREALRLLPISN